MNATFNHFTPGTCLHHQLSYSIHFMSSRETSPFTIGFAKRYRSNTDLYVLCLVFVENWRHRWGSPNVIEEYYFHLRYSLQKQQPHPRKDEQAHSKYKIPKPHVSHPWREAPTLGTSPPHSATQPCKRWRPQNGQWFWWGCRRPQPQYCMNLVESRGLYQERDHRK